MTQRPGQDYDCLPRLADSTPALAGVGALAHPVDFFFVVQGGHNQLWLNRVELDFYQVPGTFLRCCRFPERDIPPVRIEKQ
jgi:hypothetical protein